MSEPLPVWNRISSTRAPPIAAIERKVSVMGQFEWICLPRAVTRLLVHADDDAVLQVPSVRERRVGPQWAGAARRPLGSLACLRLSLPGISTARSRATSSRRRARLPAGSRAPSDSLSRPSGEGKLPRGGANYAGLPQPGPRSSLRDSSIWHSAAKKQSLRVPSVGIQHGNPTDLRLASSPC